MSLMNIVSVSLLSYTNFFSYKIVDRPLDEGGATNVKIEANV